MSVTVRIPTTLRPLAGGASTVQVAGSTLTIATTTTITATTTVTTATIAII